MGIVINYTIYYSFEVTIIMSLKVLCFGEHELLKRAIGKLRTDHRDNTDEEIVVDSV